MVKCANQRHLTYFTVLLSIGLWYNSAPNLLCLFTEMASRNVSKELRKRTTKVTYVMRSLRSFSFFSPPKAIFVPGMYFLGFSRYSNCRLISTQVCNQLISENLPEYLGSIQWPSACWHRYRRNPRLNQCDVRTGRAS